MLKFFVRALTVLLVLVLSHTVYAIGMGDVNVTSGTGEPLQADIALVAVGATDKSKLSARLASADAFRIAGMEYPRSLPKLTFQLKARADGEPYFRVTSEQPVNESFVSLLVELTWPSGRLLREYAFLLDRPGFVPAQPKGVEVQPLQPSVHADGTKSVMVKEGSVPKRTSIPVTDNPTVANRAVPIGNATFNNERSSALVTVQRGDSLGEIASANKSSEVSLERMLVALYRANEDAFDAKNMFRLQTGKILRIPAKEELNAVKQADAEREIRIQTEDWNTYRQKLATASSAAVEQAPRQEAAGKISTTVNDKTPAIKESAKEVMRLSRGEELGDKAVAGGGAGALREKKHASEEEAIARAYELKNRSERIAMLEKNINVLQRLLELERKASPALEVKTEAPLTLSKTEWLESVKPTDMAVPASAVISAPASAVIAETTSEVVTESASSVTVEVVSAVAAVPVSGVVPETASAVLTVPETEDVAVKEENYQKPVPETAAPSLQKQILLNPLYLAGLAVGLLCLGIFIGFLMTRLRSDPR